MCSEPSRFAMHLRRLTLVLVCAIFVTAPLQRAYSHVPAAGNIQTSSQTQASDIDARLHDNMLHHSPHQRVAGVNNHQNTPGCCPTDHPSQTAAFCSDCLVVGILDTPPASQASRMVGVATRRTFSQSIDFSGDAPVPKS